MRKKSHIDPWFPNITIIRVDFSLSKIRHYDSSNQKLIQYNPGDTLTGKSIDFARETAFSKDFGAREGSFFIHHQLRDSITKNISGITNFW